MEEATADPVQPVDPPEKPAGTGWQGFWFLAHLAAIYIIVTFITVRLAGWTYQTLIPALQMPSNSSRFGFLFSHLFFFSFTPALAAGFTNLELRHKAAQYVWVVPAVVLAYKLATFSVPTSVLVANSAVPFHQYFGGGFLIPEYYGWHEFWQIVGSNRDMMRGMEQLHFTAPFYAGVGYSLGAWVSLREGVRQKVSEMVTKRKQKRFESRETD